MTGQTVYHPFTFLLDESGAFDPSLLFVAFLGFIMRLFLFYEMKVNAKMK